MAESHLPKPIKILLIVILSFMVLYTAAYVVLRFAFPPEKLKAMLIPRVEEMVGRTVGVDGASISIFPYIGARLTHVSVSETKRAGFSTDIPFVTVDELRVHVALMPLLQKNMEIVKIALKEPSIRVLIDTTGSYNYDDMGITGQKDSTRGEKKRGGLPMLPVPVTLEQFRIMDGRVYYEDKRAGDVVSLGKINQSISFSIDKELKDIQSRGMLRISDIALHSKHLADTLSDITLTFDHDIRADIPGQRVQLNSVTASLQKVKISASGTATKILSPQPELDVRITGDTIQIDDLLAEVPAELSPHLAKARGEGTVLFDLAVKGALPDSGLPKMAGSLSFSNGKVAYTDLPRTINDINAAIQFTDSSLTVESFRMRVGENPVNLRANIIDFKEPFVDALVDARMDLAILTDLMILPESMGVGGFIDAQITAKGKVDPSNPAGLDLDGAIKLKDVTTTTPAVTKPVVANGTVDLTSRVVKPDVSVSLGKSRMHLKAQVTDYLTFVMPDSAKKQPRPELRFTLNSPFMNTDEFLPSGTDTSDTAMEASAAGQPPLLLPAPLPGIDMHGNISTDRLIYQEIELTGIKVKLKSVNDVMDMKVDAGMCGGSMSNDLHVDIRDNTDLKVRTVLNMNGVDVNSVVSKFNDLLPDDQKLYAVVKGMDDVLYGTAQSTMNFSSRGGTMEQITANLNGNVYAKLSDGRIAGGALLDEISKTLKKFYEVDEIAFRDMRIRARVANQNVFFDSIQIQSSTGDWAASGAVGFDSRANIDVSNRLPKNASKKVTAAEQSIKESGTSMLKDFLGNDAAKALGQLTQSIGIPTDREGRVTVLLHLGGPVTAPRVSFRGFGGGNATTGGSGASRPSAREKLNRELEQRAQKELGGQKRRLEQEAEKKLDKEKQQLQKKQEKVQEDLEKKAKDVLKKLF